MNKDNKSQQDESSDLCELLESAIIQETGNLSENKNHPLDLKISKIDEIEAENQADDIYKQKKETKKHSFSEDELKSKIFSNKTVQNIKDKICNSIDKTIGPRSSRIQDRSSSPFDLYYLSKSLNENASNSVEENVTKNIEGFNTENKQTDNDNSEKTDNEIEGCDIYESIGKFTNLEKGFENKENKNSVDLEKDHNLEIPFQQTENIFSIAKESGNNLEMKAEHKNNISPIFSKQSHDDDNPNLVKQEIYADLNNNSLSNGFFNENTEKIGLNEFQYINEQSRKDNNLSFLKTETNSQIIPEIQNKEREDADSEINNEIPERIERRFSNREDLKRYIIQAPIKELIEHYSFWPEKNKEKKLISSSKAQNDTDFIQNKHKHIVNDDNIKKIEGAQISKETRSSPIEDDVSENLQDDFNEDEIYTDFVYSEDSSHDTEKLDSNELETKTTQSFQAIESCNFEDKFDEEQLTCNNDFSGDSKMHSEKPKHTHTKTFENIQKNITNMHESDSNSDDKYVKDITESDATYFTNKESLDVSQTTEGSSLSLKNSSKNFSFINQQKYSYKSSLDKENIFLKTLKDKSKSDFDCLPNLDINEKRESIEFKNYKTDLEQSKNIYNFPKDMQKTENSQISKSENKSSCSDTATATCEEIQSKSNNFPEISVHDSKNYLSEQNMMEDRKNDQSKISHSLFHNKYDSLQNQEDALKEFENFSKFNILENSLSFKSTTVMKSNDINFDGFMETLDIKNADTKKTEKIYSQKRVSKEMANNSENSKSNEIINTSLDLNHENNLKNKCSNLKKDLENLNQLLDNLNVSEEENHEKEFKSNSQSGDIKFEEKIIQSYEINEFENQFQNNKKFDHVKFEEKSIQSYEKNEFKNKFKNNQQFEGSLNFLNKEINSGNCYQNISHITSTIKNTNNEANSRNLKINILKQEFDKICGDLKNDTLKIIQNFEIFPIPQIEIPKIAQFDIGFKNKIEKSLKDLCHKIKSYENEFYINNIEQKIHTIENLTNEICNTDYTNEIMFVDSFIRNNDGLEPRTPVIYNKPIQMTLSMKEDRFGIKNIFESTEDTTNVNICDFLNQRGYDSINWITKENAIIPSGDLELDNKKSKDIETYQNYNKTHDQSIFSFPTAENNPISTSDLNLQINNTDLENNKVPKLSIGSNECSKIPISVNGSLQIETTNSSESQYENSCSNNDQKSVKQITTSDVTSEKNSISSINTQEQHIKPYIEETSTFSNVMQQPTSTFDNSNNESHLRNINSNYNNNTQLNMFSQPIGNTTNHGLINPFLNASNLRTNSQQNTSMNVFQQANSPNFTFLGNLGQNGSLFNTENIPKHDAPVNKGAFGNLAQKKRY